VVLFWIGFTFDVLVHPGCKKGSADLKIKVSPIQSFCLVGMADPLFWRHADGHEACMIIRILNPYS
jgi:hypothetical protein